MYEEVCIPGKEAPNVKTNDICNIILKVSLIWFTLNSLNDSAQSPPINRNPWPNETLANSSCRVLTSPAKTKGEYFERASVALFASSSFG